MTRAANRPAQPLNGRVVSFQAARHAALNASLTESISATSHQTVNAA